MANWTVEERLGLKQEWVAESYEKTHNMTQTAHAMKISVATVHRILKRMGIPIDRGKVRGQAQIGRRRGCLYLWIQEHPGAKLPETVKEISQLTGCSVDAVRGFLARQKRFRSQQLPDLKRYLGTLKLNDGRYISLAAIGEYEAVVDPFSNSVALSIRTRSGETVHSTVTLEGVLKKIEEGTWRERK